MGCDSETHLEMVVRVLYCVKIGEKMIPLALKNKHSQALIMNAAPTLATGDNILKVAWLDTRLGSMVAIANEASLLLLEFVDRRGLEREVERLSSKTKSAIVPGKTKPIYLIEKELEQYFQCGQKIFNTPITLVGSDFQKQVWQALMKIPPGTTRSYADIARAIKQPSAFRAVARANGTNQIAIIIPCHRVINASGALGGYAGGISRKAWLINHEKAG
jgi:AraC family transcriptional regulator, regulatory protein of adaptative response / methylated-DNA-[protein]-cysteine methyltransferase